MKIDTSEVMTVGASDEETERLKYADGEGVAAARR